MTLRNSKINMAGFVIFTESVNLVSPNTYLSYFYAKVALG